MNNIPNKPIVDPVLPPNRWDAIISRARRHDITDRSGSFLSNLWRGLRIFAEYMHGTMAFRNITHCVTVFGSARFDEDHEYYKLARYAARTLSEAGFTIMTGGGPGIMEAANRGAKEGKSPSFGCNIKIPEEELINPYLDRFIRFKYFFVRKVMLAKYSSGFIVLPGGLGTMDELFELTTLIQTGKMIELPVILMGADYWNPLLKFMRDWMLRHGTIDQSDLDRLTITDSPDAALQILENALGKLRKNLESKQ